MTPAKPTVLICGQVVEMSEVSIIYALFTFVLRPA
jgi:hypothetical protein